MANKHTGKQQRFVEEYLVDLNATQAYRRAGYAAKTDDIARAASSRLLANVNVTAAIQQAKEARSKRVEISQDSVLNEIAKLGFANMLDYITVQPDGTAFVDLTKLTREQAAAIQEITTEEYTEGKGDDAREVRKVKLKLADKKGSLELLGKHLALFTDNINLRTTHEDDLAELE
jgi:phage terminase small subunit